MKKMAKEKILGYAFGLEDELEVIMSMNLEGKDELCASLQKLRESQLEIENEKKRKKRL